MRTPLLTVLAVCFNHERFVLECLEGIRSQTLQDFELLIVDDASTDRSVELIRAWIRQHGVDCRLVVHERNQGLCRTLNAALAMVNGRYLAKISTDDVWMPQKLEIQLRQMQALPESIAVLYGDAIMIDESGAVLEKRFLDAHGIQTPPVGDLLPVLLRRNFLPSMTTMLRTDALRRVGGYDERLVYEDWDMWLRLAQRYEFAFCDYVSARYRIVENSMVRTVARYASPNRLWSDALILEKLLRSGTLDAAQAADVRRRIWGMAKGLVRLRDVRAPAALVRALRASVYRTAPRLRRIEANATQEAEADFK